MKHRAKLLCVWVALLAVSPSCGSSQSSTDAGTNPTADASDCPPSRPMDGDACASPLEQCVYGAVYSGSCVCLDSAWQCSTCPSDLADEAACTPGASCTVYYSEDDCDCMCAPSGEWNCSSTEGVISCPFPP